MPALGALAAEPLYLLADTAIVGHLGTRPLAGLAVAGSVLTAAFSVFNFLAYSTTAGVARQLGAGHRREAAESGVDGCWLAVGLGVVLTVLGVVLAPVIVDVMGASTSVTPFAVTYLRISILGAPALLLALAGAGYLRGMQDTKTTLVIAVLANAANLLIELLFVLRARPRHRGLGVGHRPRAVRRRHRLRRDRRPRGATRRRVVAAAARRDARQRDRRQSAGRAHRVADRRAAHRDRDRVAHQRRRGGRAPDLHAGVPVPGALARRARDRRAGDGRAVPRRIEHARRPCRRAPTARARRRWSACCSGSRSVALRPWLAGAFTNDEGVRHLVLEVLWIVAALQPVAAIVFVLDGVLIGAGDAGYLALAMLVATVGVYLPAALLVAVLDGGLLWLWGAIALWMLARFVGMAGRFRTTRWEVEGAVRA